MKNNEDRILLNGEQEAALELMMSGVNVFLTGEAGTGKSTIVREFIRRSDLFCAMDARLREIAPPVSRARPFGGKQIVVVGDFMQLPPVTGSEDELRFINERLGGKFAFETDLWAAAMFRTIFLRTVVDRLIAKYDKSASFVK